MRTTIALLLPSLWLHATPLWEYSLHLDTLALQIILRQPAAPVKKAYLCIHKE
ncbi:hypothetical protein HMPREF3185_01173 [Porphyromonas somerae]|uniref:Uncharacterized protein n=1 Tax=Porphyromonas somerae TaxID=322095 RepID=A0A134B819_9PORP|nr:hypothetical protein HMPREF3184_01173 [Porphyromonadaceae bacterium KA00676]KXB76084.1 hypothetical protein HMPREF3185_01173 [Porphyromonas somerae]